MISIMKKMKSSLFLILLLSGCASYNQDEVDQIVIDSREGRYQIYKGAPEWCFSDGLCMRYSDKDRAAIKGFLCRAESI